MDDIIQTAAGIVDAHPGHTDGVQVSECPSTWRWLLIIRWKLSARRSTIDGQILKFGKFLERVVFRRQIFCGSQRGSAEAAGCPC